MRNKFLVAVAAIVMAWAPVTAAAAPRPNIVVILADDMGFSDIGCYGSEIETPNIDALAKGGVKFSQFYNTARCCPTRASLLTGMYPHQAGVGHMTSHAFKDHPGYQNELSKETPTIAEVLRREKYATYMAGKWHVTRRDGPKAAKDNWPIARGFDRYYGTIRGGGSYYDPATLTRDDKPITPASDTEYKPAEGKEFYYTDALADQAARFVREHRERNGADGKPFFMYVAFTSPHWPLHAPEEAVAKYRGKYKDGYDAIRAARFARQKEMGLIPANTELSPQAWSWAQVENKAWEERCMEVYAAQVDRMDAGVGKIVAALKEAGQFENTLIFFLSDNGGCAENMGRITHIDRIKAPATQPRKPGQVQLEVFPKHTFDGRPVWDGQAVMPGPDDSYVAYGEGWANVSNTPLRMYKHFTHEGGISTPLIAHWPKEIKPRGGGGGAGEWEGQPGHLIDIMATCVEVAGAENKRVEGVSLTPAFRGESLERRQPIFFEHEGNRAVRDGKWKLVAKSAKGQWELYDMEADRIEMHDLAASEPQRVKTMADQWQQWAECANVLPLNPWRSEEN